MCLRTLTQFGQRFPSLVSRNCSTVVFSISSAVSALEQVLRLQM